MLLLFDFRVLELLKSYKDFITDKHTRLFKRHTVFVSLFLIKSVEIQTNTFTWKQLLVIHQRFRIVYKKTDEWCIEWQRVVQRVTISANLFCFFFQIREEPTTKHPKENSLNLDEDLWRRPIELRAETSS